MQKQEQKNTANDSIFGLLAASFIGPAFGAGVGEVWQSAEIASEIYTDRYQPQTAAKKSGPFTLGAKNTLGSTFGQSVMNPAAAPAEAHPAADLYYHKLAAFQMNRRHAPRLAA
jgi:hypothetical protein